IKTAKEDPDGFCPVEMICQNGVALATFHTSQVDPDRADGYDAGIRGFLADGKPRGVSDWGALSAWGWGASQILDFTEDHPGIDHDHVAVIGHSRGGKAALWAAAEDERFSTAYSNNSGCGGAALFRRRYGETTAIITRNFPHWFCKKLNDYAGNEDALPVDQHQLIAAIAPRRVYVTSASQDLWADPKGEYLSLVHAAQVFTRLGHRAVNDPNMPPVNRPVTSGQTGYHIRQGKHNLTPQDWKYFLDFFLDVDR
ncbi:MAG: acetylxylan esterase, partial [Planctomycetota bacterium]